MHILFEQCDRDIPAAHFTNKVVQLGRRSLHRQASAGVRPNLQREPPGNNESRLVIARGDPQLPRWGGGSELRERA